MFQLKNLTLDCTRRANKSVNFIIEDSNIYKVATHGIRVKNCTLTMDMKTLVLLAQHNTGTIIYLDHEAKMKVFNSTFLDYFHFESIPLVSANTYNQVINRYEIKKLS